jgi:Transcriptional regulator/sugar kinase
MPRSSPPRRTRSELRWALAADVLDGYRREPDLSRAELTSSLQLSSGTMTDLVNRLQGARLIAEEATPPSGRGRPTTRLAPHPDGPTVAVAEISAYGWRTAWAGIDGRLRVFEDGDHRSYDATAILTEVGDSLARLRAVQAGRSCATSLSISGTLSGTEVVQSAVLGWERVELAGLAGPDTELLCANDATLAAVAEARRGAARGARVNTHLLITSGTGGGVCQDGRPLQGAIGAGAEFGHLPFGSRPLRCSCGAIGCWEVDLGARALASELMLGLTHPAQEVTAARAWLRDQDPLRPAAAVQAQAASLGRGLAGLVNALDPDVVTISGLAPHLRRLAPSDFAQAFRRSLMSFRRSSPPPVLDAELADDGPLVGAVELGLDQVFSAAGLARWVGEDDS